jgi:hypothetical protein
MDTAFRESLRVYRRRDKHQPPPRPILCLDTHQNLLFEEPRDKMSKIRTDSNLGARGRGLPLNNDPLNNNQLHNSSAARTRLLKDFATPHIDNIHSSIDVPTVDLNNFALKPALINMIQ